MNTALCAGKWWLFDSTNPADHLEARALCVQCPMRRECADIAATNQRSAGGYAALEGTWAGKLYGRKARIRMQAEEDMFTDEAARDAHAVWERTPPEERTRMGAGDRVVIGERVYQRRAHRRRKAARETVA